MTPDDTRNLFEQLLSKYFQGHPRLLDPAQRTAYHEILEPYRPADVKAAVLRCLREKRYFPDPQEIASRCPAPAACAFPGWPAYGYRDEADYTRQMQSILEEAEKL